MWIYVYYIMSVSSMSLKVYVFTTVRILSSMPDNTVYLMFGWMEG